MGREAELKQQTKLSDPSLRVRTRCRKVSVGNRKGSCCGGHLSCPGQSPSRETPVFLNLQPFLSPSFLLTVLRGMTHPERMGLFAPDLMGESHQCPLSRRETLRSGMHPLGTMDTSEPFPPRRSEPAGGTDAQGWASGPDLFVCQCCGVCCSHHQIHPDDKLTTNPPVSFDQPNSQCLHVHPLLWRLMDST